MYNPSNHPTRLNLDGLFYLIETSNDVMSCILKKALFVFGILSKLRAIICATM